MEHENIPESGPQKPQRIEDIINGAVKKFRARPEVPADLGSLADLGSEITAEPSMLRKQFKPLVNGFLLGGTRGFGDCPAEVVVRAGELYVGSLGLTSSKVREALIVARDGVDPVGQPDLYKVACTAIEGLRPFVIEAYRQGKAIEAATLAALSADRRGNSHSSVRDKSATRAREMLTWFVAKLGEWPAMGHSDLVPLLGDTSGLPLSDADVNPVKKEKVPATFFEKIDAADVAIRGLRLALRLTRNPQDAEDVLHDAIVKVLAGSAPPAASAAYFMSAVHTCALDRMRKASNEAITLGDDILQVFGPAYDGQEPSDLLIWDLAREIYAEAGCSAKCRNARSTVSATSVHYISHSAADVAAAVAPKLLELDEQAKRHTHGVSKRNVVEVIGERASAYGSDFAVEIARQATELLVTAARSVVAD